MTQISARPVMYETAPRLELVDPSIQVDFEGQFSGKDYLDEYYPVGRIEQDERLLIEWQATELHSIVSGHLATRGLHKFNTHFDAGSGPTVHHLIALQEHSQAIRIGEYVSDNRAEVRKWLDGAPDAHNWNTFTTASIQAERQRGKAATIVTAEDIHLRELALRRKIVEPLVTLDLLAPTPYSADFVTSFFVADSATQSKDTFKHMTNNAFKITKAGGMFVAAYLGGCDKYRVGAEWFPSASVTEQDITDAFEQAGADTLHVKRVEVPEMAEEGFDHQFYAVATAKSA